MKRSALGRRDNALRARFHYMIFSYKLLPFFIGVLIILTTCSPPPRPERVNYTEPLFQGVKYSRYVYDDPRPILMHVLKVDLTVVGVKLFVTPGHTDHTSADRIFNARTTSAFLDEFTLQVAINGGFFSPRDEQVSWESVLASGDELFSQGLTISDGVVYGQSMVNRPVLCVLSTSQVVIRPQDCPADTQQAVAGFPMLLEQGIPTDITSSDYLARLHPRTAVAIDQFGLTVWLVTVDGHQSGYSEGVFLAELAELLRELGAYTALNLDGGGSTAMAAMNNEGQSYLLNSPIHLRVPLRERPVATHLGVYALPLDP